MRKCPDYGSNFRDRTIIHIQEHQTIYDAYYKYMKTSVALSLKGSLQNQVSKAYAVSVSNYLKSKEQIARQSYYFSMKEVVLQEIYIFDNCVSRLINHFHVTEGERPTPMEIQHILKVYIRPSPEATTSTWLIKLQYY